MQDLHISEELQKQIDKEYLDFLVNLYMSAFRSNQPCFDEAKRTWFVQEIALVIRTLYPQLSKAQYSDLLKSIYTVAEKDSADRINE